MYSGGEKWTCVRRKTSADIFVMRWLLQRKFNMLKDDFREAHPHLPWKSMAGMRDRLIHGYFDVNLDVIWETLTEDLPPLVAKLEKTVGD